MRRPKEATPAAIVVDLLRAAQRVLPLADLPLAERLFALECAYRAGPSGRPLVVELGPSLREAEHRVETDWEQDVPHLPELAQATSAVLAGGGEVPETWTRRLDDAARSLSKRKGRFGLRVPRLIAPVLRGLAAAGCSVPPRLLADVAAAVTRNEDPAGLAELAEALVRLPGERDLATRTAITAFADTDGGGPEGAIARWWLAERWRDLTTGSLPVSPNLQAQARLVALATTDLRDPRAALRVPARPPRTSRPILTTPWRTT